MVMNMKIFLSYPFSIEKFVRKIFKLISKHPQIEPYCYGECKKAGKWGSELGREIEKSEAIIIFCYESLDGTQGEEVNHALDSNKTILPVKFSNWDINNAVRFSAERKTMEKIEAFASINVDTPIDKINEKQLSQYTKEIIGALGNLIDNGLPEGYPFDYEKGIIELYDQGISEEYLSLGCPESWPEVTKNQGEIDNCLNEDEIGLYRDWDHQQNCLKTVEPLVIPAALSEFDISSLLEKGLSFPEAGPRKKLFYPYKDKKLKAAILVSGGIAPGINAVIEGIVERHLLYAEQGQYDDNFEIYGYLSGFEALHLPGNKYINLNRDVIKDITNLGGSILGTSRLPVLSDPGSYKRRESLERIVGRLINVDDIDILYIIGGDGSMKAAHSIYKTAMDQKYSLSVVAVPKTMDNDILWVWQSFGFLSAVEKAKEAIQLLYTEAKSNSRLCVIQLFGSDSGFVVAHAALASGVCDLILTPELPFNLKKISKYIQEKLQKRRKKSSHPTYGIIAMAETAIPLDGLEIIEKDLEFAKQLGITDKEIKAIKEFEKNERRVIGKTPDALRSVGLKLVSGVLQRDIQTKKIDGSYWSSYKVVTNEPRHLIRAIPPSTADITFGQRLGTLAVDCAMAGYTDFMISQWLTEFVMVPLGLVVLGRKRIPQSGIFLKSVRANTGQPADLT